MKVTMLGPNLSSKHQAVAQFHVHAFGCMDVERQFRGEHRTVLSVDSRRQVAGYLFGPDAGGFYEEAGGDERNGSLDNFLDAQLPDIHFAPCVKGLK